MEFRELKTFQVVANLLSFTKAADILNYAQSTVSSQIQSIENSLGETLFYRSGNKISLTPAGVKLLHYAQRLINIEKEILSNFKDVNENTGNLIIKTPQTVSAYYLPSILKEFQFIFPKIGFDIDWCTSYNLKDLFYSGAADLAFLISDSYSDKNLEVDELAKINLVLAGHPEDELIKQRVVSLKDLNNKTILLTKSDCNYKNILQKMIIESNVHIKNIIEINSIDAVKQLLMLGSGIAMLPDIVIKDELKRGELKIVNWKGPAFKAKLFMIWNKEKYLAEPLKAFMYLIRKNFNK